ncbi:MAG: transketolase C-terminal domain-containing protein [Thermodesulfobacteriota bacterium]|nr:transketolase C-terminal domain-containing protein [Thermodesulfobacteriota bacterium]
MDFILGRMLELVDNRHIEFGDLPEKDWAFVGKGKKGDRSAHILSDILGIPPFFERQIAKYNSIKETLTKHETYLTDDVELLLVAYGSSARSSQDAVDMPREEGLKVNMLQSITLWSFPQEAVKELSAKIGKVLVAEDRSGGLVEDAQASVSDQVQLSLLNILARHNPTPKG